MHALSFVEVPGPMSGYGSARQLTEGPILSSSAEAGMGMGWGWRRLRKGSKRAALERCLRTDAAAAAAVAPGDSGREGRGGEWRAQATFNLQRRSVTNGFNFESAAAQAAASRSVVGYRPSILGPSDPRAPPPAARPVDLQVRQPTPAVD